jgi:hypothetical protein
MAPQNIQIFVNISLSEEGAMYSAFVQIQTSGVRHVTVKDTEFGKRSQKTPFAFASV